MITPNKLLAGLNTYEMGLSQVQIGRLYETHEDFKQLIDGLCKCLSPLVEAAKEKAEHQLQQERERLKLQGMKPCGY